jgi:hypothetical protein
MHVRIQNSQTSLTSKIPLLEDLQTCWVIYLNWFVPKVLDPSSSFPTNGISMKRSRYCGFQVFSILQHLRDFFEQLFIIAGNVSLYIVNIKIYQLAHLQEPDLYVYLEIFQRINKVAFNSLN